ncbi:40S ribosomal protein S2 [Culex quinquefasciatus]|uniref:40S ribosomal protein S2 n=1 Tax=Culex quinquefasciatus TaxID=7176 RepID=B0WDW0_CULQU|nr:40S ribosomal protein S2 [Culex quinquefasciatus]|eukprot:XP_001846894.1 40S ribosomal protein S2 [Culex quinquefasciatus]
MTNVLKMPVQRQTRAGQRTRFKTFVAIGDTNGHICLGVKCSKEVATAIRSAIILAKLAVKPVRRGYWGNKIGKPHTVLCKIFGKCGSVLVCLNPVLRGTAIGRPRSRRSLPRWPVSRIASESRNSPAIPIIAPAAETGGTCHPIFTFPTMIDTDSTARNCTVSSANTFTDPTAGGDSGDLFQADGLLVEATPLKSILEVKVGGQPPGLLAVHESAQGTFQLVARRWKSTRSTTRARCTGHSTSIRVAPPPTSRTREGPTLPGYGTDPISGPSARPLLVTYSPVR